MTIADASGRILPMRSEFDETSDRSETLYLESRVDSDLSELELRALEHLPMDIRTQVLLKRRNKHVSVMRPYMPNPLPAHGDAFNSDDSETVPEDSPIASGVSSPDTPPDQVADRKSVV